MKTYKHQFGTINMQSLKLYLNKKYEYFMYEQINEALMLQLTSNFSNILGRNSN